MKKITIYFLLILNLFNKNINANHVIGGDVSYIHLGQKKYEVKYKIIRDCMGIPLDSLNFYVSNYTNKVQIYPTRIKIDDITMKCADSTRKPCSPSNSMASKGFESHIFLDTIDLNSNPFNQLTTNNCKIFFTVKQCCRIINIQMNSDIYFNEAMIDLCHTNYVNSSPQYLNENSIINSCNIGYYQTYGGIEQSEYDSIVYKLEYSKTDEGSYITYSYPFSPSIPFTPYCPPNPGTINCKPLPSAKPPRGFYFESNTGNVIFTPVRCDEANYLCVISYEYRKINNKWEMVGFSSRDIAITIINSNNYMSPNLTVNNNLYKFKVGEKNCVEFHTNDSSNTGINSSNETTIKIYNQPKGSVFSYVDSTAINKTARLCWTPHDTDYLKIKSIYKEVPIIIETFDRYCYYPGINQRMYKLKINPPDSSGIAEVKTYLDKNKNTRLDLNDSLLSIKLSVNNGKTRFYAQSNNELSLKLKYGNYNIGVANHPYISNNPNDTNLTVVMDSTHQIDFNVKFNKGIYGRIYHDKNLNCKFDAGDVPLSSYVVKTDTGNYTGISDLNGIYYINAPAGNYKIYCLIDTIKNKINCLSNQYLSINMPVDSAYFNFDFPITLNAQFKDISTYIKLVPMRRGSRGDISLICYNNGYTTMRNFKLIVPDIGKYSFIYGNGNNTYKGDTAVFSIDSILPLSKYTIFGSVYADPNIKFPNWQMCLKAYTDSLILKSDSNTSNNLFKTCVDINRPYDPNDKRITNDSSKTTIDKFINYKIRFQNKGNDTAVRVVVVDTIDTKFLDISKFKLINSQYPCSVTFNDHLIYFIFDGIYLPYESKSFEKSIAEFEFSLGLKNPVKEETFFENSAAIFFDYEDAVITKPVVASINSPLIISNLKHEKICINAKYSISYKSNIQLQTDNLLSVEMSDSNGSFNSPITLNQIKSQLDSGVIEFSFPKNLKEGNYLLRLKSSNPPSVGIPNKGVKDINVFALPIVKVNTNLKNEKICLNDTLKLNINNPNYTYKIVKNNNYTSNFSSNLNYQYRINKNDEFKIIVNDKNLTKDCYDTISLIPIVNNLPIVDISIDNRRYEYCENSEITIKASGANLYSFYKNEVETNSNSKVDSVSYTLVENSTFKVIGIDSNSCSNYSDTLQVKINPNPISILDVKPNPSCVGDSIYVILDKRYVHDVFINKDIYSSNNNNEKFLLNPISDGDEITAIARTNKNCIQSTNQIAIVINEKPIKPDIIISGNTISINSNLTIKWYYNGVLMSNTSNTINNALSGKYWATVTNSDGCYENSDTVYFQNSNLNVSEKNKVIQVTPNPSNDMINIEFIDEKIYVIQIFDINGRTISSSFNNGLKNISMDVKQLTDGIYTIQVIDEFKNMSYYKLVIN